MEQLHYWIDLGMPIAASFKLQIHPLETSVPAADNQWIVKRHESQFVWRLDI